MSYGERLRYLREQRGMTQEDLGNKINVSKQMICQFERGTKNITLPIAKELVTALGVKMSALTGE
mgnify:CR=1 FL=1